MQKKILAYLALVVVAYLLYAMLFPAPKSESIIGKKAPDFQTINFAKEKFVLGDHIGKKIILVNLWATWCPPCREEIPVLNALQDKYGPDKFLIVSIMEDSAPSLDALKATFEKFTAKLPVKYPVYLDVDNTIADLFGTFLDTLLFTKFFEEVGVLLPLFF